MIIFTAIVIERREKIEIGNRSKKEERGRRETKDREENEEREET